MATFYITIVIVSLLIYTLATHIIDRYFDYKERLIEEDKEKE